MDRRCDCPRPGGCAWCTLLTVPDAADLVDRTPATIRSWIRAGRLAAHRAGRAQFVLEADLLTCDRETRRAAAASRWTTR